MKERYHLIDVFRYVCAILVIAIHTRPFEEINPSMGFIATSVIPRIAVPFFFIVSGYFYISKLQDGKKPFIQYIKRIIEVYFAWSCLYFFIEFVQWGYADLKGFVGNCVLSFFYFGSAYHFWFFPALIISVCFTTLLWKLGGKQILIPMSIVLYIIGVLGCAYYNVFQNIPILEQLFNHSQFNSIRRILLMGFPFFCGGYLTQIIRNKISKRQSSFMLVFSLLIWIIEILIVVKMQYQRSIVITFGLYPLVVLILTALLQNPMLCMKGISDMSRKISNFTYYIHPAFIMLITYLWLRIPLGKSGISNTELFFYTIISTFAVGVLICKINIPTVQRLIS